ncbi:epimerase [Thalassobius vesicularis]|uniref:Epimerase n=1 Tax=Thalassobius vesicularis TaxID=1294297 RepID=A0A4S3MDC2_9RHOB|nr:epimerase [Thalassobius vesicularis]THD76612.1 epimerase [Thalassobius vesicularis]
MAEKALILGASGRFGRNVADAFQAAGWTRRRFDRRTDRLEDAAQGADVIVAGWNPKYQDWAAQVPGQQAQIRRVALANDATVIFPGNVYVFGPDSPMPWGAKSPHLATNPLGMIRRKAEDALRDEGVKTIVLRAGDFLDTEPSGNWFDMMMAKTLPKGRLTYPGRTDAVHAWAYLPDLARAAVALAQKRDSLARFEDVAFPGYTLTGTQMAQALAPVMERPVMARQMSWLPLHLARPFMPMAKHLFEMRYLWNLPHQLSSERFDALLPDFQHTPLQEALSRATAHLPR